MNEQTSGTVSEKTDEQVMQEARAAKKAEQKAKAPAKKAAKAKAPAKKAAKKAKKAAGAVKAGTGPEALKAYAPQYHHDKDKKTAGGNVSVDSDDEVAKKLRGKSLDDVYAIVGKVCAPDFDEKALRAKYKHLNFGMQRMNLGNKMRGVLNAK